MYKLLFAEDEPLTRNGILNEINWEELGITEIKTAKNGRLAYELALDFQPDILLTDIKMPKMDGIELSHKIREINPNCSILIISGYSEKEYLRAALSLRAIDFVDKPIKINHLTELLKNAVNEQDNIIQHIQYLNKQAILLPTLPAWSADKYYDYVKELIPSINQFVEGIVVLLKFVESEDSSLGLLMDSLPLKKQLISILKQWSLRFILDSTENSNIFLHIYLTSGQEFDCGEFANKICEKWSLLSPDYDFYLFFGSREKIYNQNLSCIHAVQMSKYLFFNKAKHSLIYTNVTDPDLKRHSCHPIVNLYSDIQMLDSLISSSDKDGILTFLQQLKTQISDNYVEYDTSDIMKLYALVLIKILNLQTPIKYDENFILYELSECIFLDDVHECMTDYVRSIFPETQNNLQPNIIESILSLIHEQYFNKELSLKWISRQIFLSPAYICVKFKEQTNMTISQYVNDYRINIAKTLLANPEIKINDIAEKVGFDNGNYFSKIFRKTVGVSPSEYRTNLTG